MTRLEPAATTIRTARLELVSFTPAFVEAVKRGDVRSAEEEIGADVRPWLMAEPSHLIRLQLAHDGADADGLDPLGWAVVLSSPAGDRWVIGSVGVHGPVDERGRLEVGHAIDPASRGRGYAAEAVRAVLDWAAMRYGVNRLVIAIQPRLRQIVGRSARLGHARVRRRSPAAAGRSTEAQGRRDEGVPHPGVDGAG